MIRKFTDDDLKDVGKPGLPLDIVMMDLVQNPMDPTKPMIVYYKNTTRYCPELIVDETLDEDDRIYEDDY